MDYENTEKKDLPEETDELQSIHKNALKQLDDAQNTEPVRRECREDRRFVSVDGAQWEGDWARHFEDTPKMVFNKILNAVTRVENEYRNNRISVRFAPTPESSQEEADTVQGLFRADEQDSCAEEGYDNMFSEGLKGGYGSMRLRVCEEDEEDPGNEKKRIQFEPIYDADYSVWFDPNSEKYDKSDAKWCHLIKRLTFEAFEEQYPDAAPTSVQVEHWTRGEYEWFKEKDLAVSEYYKVEMVPETLYGYEMLTGEQKWYSDQDFELNEDLEERLLATGAKSLGKKEVKRKKVRKVIMSGAVVLEDCGYIAGKHIPIAPFYGHREVIDGIERFYSFVRFAKDAQRLGNMQKSKLAEISSLDPVSIPIFYDEEIAGHQKEWQKRNINRYAFLTRKMMKDQEGNPIPTNIQYTKTAEIPQAMAAAIDIADKDLSDILGNQEKGDKIVSNISGKAVDKVQKRLDYVSFIYMSNFAKTLARVGEIWFSMAQDTYVEEGRKLKGVSQDGRDYGITIREKKMNQDGFPVIENDLRSSKFKFTYDIAPSYESARESAFESTVAMLGVVSDPEAKKALEYYLMMNISGENTEGLRNFARNNLLRMGAATPTDEEKAQLEQEQQQPDPQAEFLQAESEKNRQLARKAEADTVHTLEKAKETQAKTRETKAKTLKTLDEIGQNPQTVNINNE